MSILPVPNLSGSNTSGRWPSFCLLLPLAFFLILFFFTAWIAAASGLVDIPVLSRIAYDNPEPVHFVSVVAGSTNPLATLLAEEPSLTALSKIARRSGQVWTLFITEEMATAELRSALEKVGQENSAEIPFAPTRAQIAFDAEKGMEFFLPLANTKKATAFQVQAILKVEDNDFTLDLHRVALGSLTVPFFIRHALAVELEQRILDRKEGITQSFDFQDIRYRDGFLEIDILPKAL